MRLLLLPVLLSGCAGLTPVGPLTPYPAPSATAAERAPRDTPSRFVRADGTAMASTPCANPAVDPRTGDRLRLVRQREGRLGDYAVSVLGRYGVQGGEGLRLDCTTGRALRIVRM